MSRWVDEDEWMSHQIASWGDAVLRFASVYTGNRDLAQDVAQETFARVLVWRRRHPSRYLHPGWLFSVARNISVDVLRRLPDQRDIEPRQPDSSGDSLTRLAVRQALRRLPAKDRECLVLFYFADWPIVKIAAHTRTTPAAVKMRLQRAKARFRKSWGGAD